MRYNIKHLGTRVREERLKRKLTIEQLSEIIDVTPGFINYIENGKRGFSVEKLIDIANYFNVIIDDLLCVNKEKPDYRQEKLIEITRDMDNDKFELLIKIADAIK